MLKRIFNHLYFTWLFIFQIFFLLPRFKNKYFLLIIFKHLVPLNPFGVTLLPGHTFQFLLGNLEAFTGQTKSLQRVLGVPWGLLPFDAAQKGSKGRSTGSIWTRCPNHLMLLLFFQKKRNGSTSRSLRMSELLYLLCQWFYVRPLSAEDFNLCNALAYIQVAAKHSLIFY